jgi:pseudouridine-5'-phosphate glycosidase
MNPRMPGGFHLSKEASYALTRGLPIVALESAVITHGLPRPTNLELARELEQIVRQGGAVPATIALMNGLIKVGLTENELMDLAQRDDVIKISLRNMGIGIARGYNGGTTVAATLFAAQKSGIKTFATGGIGGVHRGQVFDISADLNALAENPAVVVCTGAKSILDLPATLEALETRGVPILGFRTSEFPAFYTRNSGLAVDCSVDQPAEVVEIARAHWKAGHRSAVLVVNPIPEVDALDPDLIENAIKEAISDADENRISGAALTPFLLDRVNQASKGKSLKANLALLRNNAMLAAQIAVHFSPSNIVSF